MKKQSVASVFASFVVASLLPACVTEVGDDDVIVDEAQQGLGRRITSQILTTGNRVNAWGVTTMMSARLLDQWNQPIANAALKLKIGTATYNLVTDASGIATLEDDFSDLGVPAQHTVTWSYAGDLSTYLGSSASHTLKILKSDCRVEVEYDYFNTATDKHAIGARVFGRDGWELDSVPVEFTVNNNAVGTVLTNTVYQSPQYVAGIEVPQTTATGTVVASFAGDAYFAPCAAYDNYDLTPKPPGRLWVTPSLSAATVGSSTVTLTVGADQWNGAVFQPRPNTKLTVTAVINGGNGTVGEVTTNASGYATLTVPVTAVAGSASFQYGTTYFKVETDAPIDYKPWSDFTSSKMTVAKGTVKFSGTTVKLGGYMVHGTFTATNKATGKTIAGLSVYSPCSTSTSTSTTDANGQISCDYDSRWGFYDNWGYWHYGTLTALPKTAWETTWF